MKLSEAIRYGSTLRPESHQERFCHVENNGTLRSDVWGAACEAVHPNVSKRSWTNESLAADLEYLNYIQHRYFGEYFRMPARCPLAQRSYVQGRGRVVDRFGHVKLEGTKEKVLGGVTSECAMVKTLAGFVDHAFYAHGNSRVEIAQMVELYEQARAAGTVLMGNIDLRHYQDESLRRQISWRLNLAAREREQQRAARRRQLVS